MNESRDAGGRGEAPFISHLIELRNRLIRIVIAVGLLFVPLAFFRNDIFTFVAGPLMARMPAGTSMIATAPTAPFFTPFKLALVVAIFLSVPFILWQIWAFIAPALYQHEKRFAMPLLSLSTILFYAGVLFAYFVVLPVFFSFIVHVTPHGVQVMTDITSYLDFVLTIFFAFGLAFEIPIAIVLMVWTGILTPEALTSKRPYILIGSFVVGMLLTPPDIFSQTLLALPMYGLFEFGIFLSRVMVVRRRREREDEDRDDDDS
ncbi:MAG TPA: twin-arginine translocase subunit TatC [Gammaproteobacteria bacterium]|nr:twin-arginine translocase subunit TatC [Gammaproteobacteria bacterium]